MHGDAKDVIVALTLAHRGRPADDLRPGVPHRTVRAPDKSHRIKRAVYCIVIATDTACLTRAQPAHQRLPPPASPYLGAFCEQSSHRRILMRLTAPACSVLQSEHQRDRPSLGSPKLGHFRPQLSHFLLTTKTIDPGCPLAQPAHLINHIESNAQYTAQ